MSTIKDQTSNAASLSTGNVTPTTSTNITTAETETESSSTVVYGAISAVLVVLVLVVVMVVIISCLLIKRSSRSKKYDVGKSSGIINPMINTTIYDDANIANTNVRFQASEQQVQFLGVSASNFEDPVKTLKQCSDEEAEYSDLSAATISGTVCINRQSNTVTYRPSQEESISEALPPILANVDFDEQKKDLTEYNNGESHTNQLYMEINGGKRDLNEAIMEEPSYASNDDPLFPGTFTSQTHIDVEREMEKNNVNEQEKGIPIYASNDDPLIAETFTNQTYMDLNGKTKEHFEEGIENQTYIANEETSGNHRREKPVSSMNRRDITESMKNPTFLNQLYIQNEPKRQATTQIYEAPATQQTELYSQLKRKNAKHIPRSLITIGEPLGSGFYGRVYKATYLSKGANTIEVAIKTLSEGASEQEKVKFLQEAAIMAQFKHINVLKLHGIVIEKDSCMIVTELMKKGDLKQLLVTLKPDPGELGSGELPHTLLNFSRQICMGLTYLSEKGFVHRDIAARNILVATNSVCKIADFGLSRDLEEENYYFANKEAKVPVKWTAPEALHYRKYSTASDVWSFGCLLYEIWTLGSVPFTGVTNLESIRQVEKGFRLPPPPGCSKSIYELMMKCWHPDPNSRPRFQDIMLTLLQQDTVILSIPDKDLNSDSQAGTLGATLNAGEKMYSELQKIYST